MWGCTNTPRTKPLVFCSGLFWTYAMIAHAMSFPLIIWSGGAGNWSETAIPLSKQSIPIDNSGVRVPPVKCNGYVGTWRAYFCSAVDPQCFKEGSYWNGKVVCAVVLILLPAVLAEAWEAFTVHWRLLGGSFTYDTSMRLECLVCPIR